VPSQADKVNVHPAEASSDIDTRQVAEMLELDDDLDDQGMIGSAVGNGRAPQGPKKSVLRNAVERSKGNADTNQKGVVPKAVTWANLPEDDSEWDDEDQDPSFSYQEPLETESDNDIGMLPEPVPSQTKAVAQKKAVAVMPKKRGRPASTAQVVEKGTHASQTSIPNPNICRNGYASECPNRAQCLPLPQDALFGLIHRTGERHPLAYW
jgi:hypothetical protein